MVLEGMSLVFTGRYNIGMCFCVILDCQTLTYLLTYLAPVMVSVKCRQTVGQKPFYKCDKSRCVLAALS